MAGNAGAQALGKALAVDDAGRHENLLMRGVAQQ